MFYKMGLWPQEEEPVVKTQSLRMIKTWQMRQFD